MMIMVATIPTMLFTQNYTSAGNKCQELYTNLAQTYTNAGELIALGPVDIHGFPGFISIANADAAKTITCKIYYTFMDSPDNPIDTAANWVQVGGDIAVGASATVNTAVAANYRYCCVTLTGSAVGTTPVSSYLYLSR